MALERLLGNLPIAEFVEQHLHRLPFSRSTGARDFVSLGTWDVLESILEQPSPDVIVAREGLPWDGPLPPSAGKARELYAEGYTIAVRHAERHHPGLAELSASFEEDFRAPVNVHLYLTPAGGTGFGWHYDAEDVFILQTEGRKEYELRKNTVHPWPLVETIPQDMGFKREAHPLGMRCALEAGDWLYIPAGWWHLAKALDPAVSLAVGIMSPAAVELLDFLRRDVLGSVIWRQRLPVLGRANPLSSEELLARHRTLLAELAEDLARRLKADAAVERFLAWRRDRGATR